MSLNDAYLWFMAHKAQLGTAMLTFAGMLQAGIAAEQWASPYIGPVCFVLTYLGSLLATSGVTKSDKYFQEKIEIQKGTGDGLGTGN